MLIILISVRSNCEVSWVIQTSLYLTVRLLLFALESFVPRLPYS